MSGTCDHPCAFVGSKTALLCAKWFCREVIASPFRTPYPVSAMTKDAPLIVGAGLAGVLLAWRLEQAGRRFRLIGDSRAPSASEVAAGMINPVTGRWMTKTWRIDTLLPEAEKTYRSIEQQFGIQIYHSIPVRRYCQNPEDAKRVARRMHNPRYHKVLGAFHPAGDGPAAFLDSYGSFDIRHAAYVDLPLLLKTLRRHFGERGNYSDAPFHYERLTRKVQGWDYDGCITGTVIFCEGAGVLQNPWFNKLPLAPAKGETLLLECPSLNLPKALYQHWKWLLAYGDHSFRLGATFNEADLSAMPTAEGARELQQALAAFLAPGHAFTLRKHYAGIRPCTRDSRPLIGPHPGEPGLFIFNGLGSKGASLAPAYSRHLIHHLLDQAPLDPEVDVARW